ncbi:MAG TPA: cell wall-binding repeat-containing protein [Egibacteraceae bacterium]|nr:cell wall-binding repeat-containing protein [Egibacteraceae bacterium]
MRSAAAGALACALLLCSSAAALASDDEPPTFRAWSTGDSTDYRQVVALTYPTARGTTYRDDYDALRGGGTRVHRATDIFGAMGERVYAAQSGTIVWMAGQDPVAKHPTAGYGMQIRGPGGRVYAYYHLGPDSAGPSKALAPGLEKGDRVERGQHLGFLGDSGNAAGGTPHLHFEIHDDRVTDPYGSNRINPFLSLRDAEHRGDYPSAGGVRVGPPLPGEGAGPDAVPAPAPVVDRIAGRDRVGTAVALSRAAFDAAEHVVVAAAGSFADSVAAGPLAARRGGPVLTTRAARLEQDVVDEITRLGATRVTVVGGEAVVPVQVERDLVDRAGVAPSRIDRLSGANRYETAAAIARAVWAGGGVRRAGVALGTHPEEERAWPDALAAGYHGAVSGAPVLLVAPHGVPGATAAALEGVAEATVVGGTGVVSDDVFADVARRAGVVRRLAGPDRYTTAAAVAEDLLGRGVSPRRIWAATGRSYADALAAAPAVARAGEVLLLVDGLDDGKDARLGPWLTARGADIRAGRVIGGAAAVTEDARRRLAERIA